jgi:hypothetical protein
LASTGVCSAASPASTLCSTTPARFGGGLRDSSCPFTQGETVRLKSCDDAPSGTTSALSRSDGQLAVMMMKQSEKHARQR